ncbi:MAG TPA: protein kinase, partial [Anaerolineae bacterium]|nr:protein kinase [Anaerolineae bacterium]
MGSTNLVGRTLGDRYRIDELIGRGGMSAVYKAYDPNLKRVVAIKVIHPHLADDPKFVARFEEEATAVARLRHPNIVQVFDFSHDGDLYYMVQEFVPGETLQDHLRRLNKDGREIAVEDAIRYAVDICEAVGYAHRRGMIHRDIKPANIMLDVHGRAILMDFGIVKITGSSQHTVAGAVVGTALYMPPELIRGEVPDPRSDIYSLGVTLHEALSGRPPFEADSAMTLLMMHLQDPPPNLCTTRAGVPAALCDIVRKAMAKNRQDRYESTAAMAEELRTLSAQLEAGPAVHFQATELDLGSDVEPVVDATQLDVPSSVPPRSPAVEGTEPDAGPGVARRGSRATPPPPPAPRETPVVAPPGAGETEPRQDRREPAVARPALRDRIAQPRVWMSGVAVLAAIVLALVFFLSRLGDGAGAVNGDGAMNGASNGSTPSVALVADTPTLTATETASATTMAHGDGTMEAPVEGTPSPSPTAVVSATITGVVVDVENHYTIDFETVGFDPAGTGPHVHFFFDNVAPAAAGWPEQGTYLRHTGPSPFAGFTTADRPPNAGQICIVVASVEHVPQPETASCVPLPDVVAATANEPLACRYGPGEEYPALSEVDAGASALVYGLSANELWWAVVDPHDPEQNCWLSTLTTTATGDLSTLPIVEAPPPGSEPELKSIEIVSITVDAESRYVVDFEVDGFEPAYPGTHIHFFFNTFSPADVGIGGDANRRSYGGAPPFTGYTTEERPPNATELCSVVANPEHSVVPESGNCFLLPDLPSAEITSIELGDA